MTVFIDSGVLVGAANPADRMCERARQLLREAAALGPVTTDHVVVESFLLLQRRRGHDPAKRFWTALRETPLFIESVTGADMERGEAIITSWRDQEFSIVDCTSFAVMERLGCNRVASFDADFAVYRYGAGKRKAFEILR